ncbi:MAG: hypothetical protein N4A72_21905 [Bacteroidales bacterium]|jgi:hypothetical protein|nr:hypothetical protein [Bacteroidales bacterium]
MIKLIKSPEYKSRDNTIILYNSILINQLKEHKIFSFAVNQTIYKLINHKFLNKMFHEFVYGTVIKSK